MGQVILRAFVMIAEKSHDIPRIQLFARDYGQRILLLRILLAGEKPVPAPFPSCVVSRPAIFDGPICPLEIERPLGGIIPAFLFGIIDEV